MTNLTLQPYSTKLARHQPPDLRHPTEKGEREEVTCFKLCNPRPQRERERERGREGERERERQRHRDRDREKLRRRKNRRRSEGGEKREE